VHYVTPVKSAPNMNPFLAPLIQVQQRRLDGFGYCSFD